MAPPDQESGERVMNPRSVRAGFMLVIVLFLVISTIGALAAAAPVQIVSPPLLTLPAPAPAPGKTPGNSGSSGTDDNLSPKLVAGGLTMAVEAGFGGYGLIGSWIPVKVSLANDGPDTKVDVKLPVLMENSTVEYVYQVTLAKGAQKEVLLAEPVSQMISSITVELAAGGKSLGKARAPLNTSAMTDIFVGVLANDPATGRFLGAVGVGGGSQPPTSSSMAPGQARVTPVSLGAGDIPTNSVLLDSFRAIIINDFAASNLDQAQWRALENWVSAGGSLFVAGGPSWSKTFNGLPESLRPGQISGTVNATGVAALESYTGKKISGGSPISLARLTPAQGSDILVGSKDLPLVTRRAMGSGNLLYVAFDLNLEPFAGWSGSPVLWEKLLAQTGARQNVSMMKGGYGYKVPKRQSQIAWAVRNIDAAQLPPAAAIGGIILLYVLALGPANYLVLKKLDRRHLTWITVPALAVVFAVGVWALAFKDKGRDLIATTISVVNMAPGSQVARVDTYGSLFAPSRSTFRVNLTGSPVVSALPYSDGPYQGQGQVVARVTQGAETSVDLLDMNMWTIRGFLAEQDADVGGAITGELKTQGDHVVGVVRNQTPYDLTDCVVLVGTSFQQIERLPAGGQASVDFQVSQSQGYVGSVPSQIYGLNKATPTGMVPVQPDRGIQRKTQTLDGLIQTGSLPGPVTFFGWADSTLGLLKSAQQPKQAGQQRNLALFTTGLRISLGQGGDLSVPMGLLRARIIDSTGNTGWFPDGFYVGDGQLTVQVDGSPELRQAKTLTLGFPTDHNQNVFKAPGLVIEVYDWQSGSWTKVTPDETVSLSQPARYVSDTGAVTVRITNDNRQGVNMRSLTLQASGR